MGSVQDTQNTALSPLTWHDVLFHPNRVKSGDLTTECSDLTEMFDEDAASALRTTEAHQMVSTKVRTSVGMTVQMGRKILLEKDFEYSDRAYVANLMITESITKHYILPDEKKRDRPVAHKHEAVVEINTSSVAASFQGEQSSLGWRQLEESLVHTVNEGLQPFMEDTILSAEGRLNKKYKNITVPLTPRNLYRVRHLQSFMGDGKAAIASNIIVQPWLLPSKSIPKAT